MVYPRLLLPFSLCPAPLQPTLNPGATADRTATRRDWVLVDRWAARTLEFRRGDVVTLRSPKQPGTSMTKRIIALDGDVLRCVRHLLLSSMRRVKCNAQGPAAEEMKYVPCALCLYL